MSSELDIWNAGLMAIGAKPRVGALTEDSENQRLCSTFYPVVLDAVLRSHPWNCAIHRRTLTPLNDTPDSDWDVQYQLPSNPHCLRVLQVGDKDDEPPIEWVVEGRRILTDEGTSIKIKYIKRITDTNEFDPLLVDAISIRLAIKLAMPIANDRSVVNDLIKELELITLPLARTIDAQEGSTQAFETDTFTGSRR